MHSEGYIEARRVSSANWRVRFVVALAILLGELIGTSGLADSWVADHRSLC